MCREKSPALPWAGLASRAPRPASWRTVPRRPAAVDHPDCGPARGVPSVVATSLLGEPLDSVRSGCRIAGDRVHRGEPLLLGGGVEYQISYRNSSKRDLRVPGSFPTIAPKPL